MSREIKFRAWLNGEMRYAYDSQRFMLEWIPEGFFLNVRDKDDRGGTTVNYPILMQYTGLNDKNGKEIYEGDIVRFITKGGKERIVPIRWEQAGFYPRRKRSFNTLPLHAAWIHKEGFEVIGNIHETPELLS